MNLFVFRNIADQAVELSFISDSSTKCSDNDSPYHHYLKHNTTLECFKDVFGLMNKPKSVYFINKRIAELSVFEYFFYVYCVKCAEYQPFTSKTLIRTCGHCGSKLMLKETNYFVYVPIIQQIEYSFRRNFDEIMAYEEKVASSTCMRDIQTGLLWQKIKTKYESSDCVPLSLSLNSDGAKLFNSNTNSLWPIQLIQHYLPPTLRYLLENILVVGLFYGQSKDVNFLHLLKPLCEELNNVKMDFHSFTTIRSLDCSR